MPGDSDRPSIDPRILEAQANPIMGRGSHRSPPSDEPISATTLTNLCDRLNQVDGYIASLGGHLTGLNDRLAGSTPQSDGVRAAPGKDNPSGCLGYAHSMIDEINRRLQYLEGELKRLDRNLGE